MKMKEMELNKVSVRGWKITNYGYHVKGLFSPYLAPKMTAVLEAYQLRLCVAGAPIIQLTFDPDWV